MNKAKSFLIFILLFSLLFCFSVPKASAASPYLRLTSTPTGATIYINKVKQSSLTPYIFKTFVPKTRYALLFSKPGYVPKTIQITAPTVNSSLAVVLKKVLIIKIASSPTGATVYVNGVKQTKLTPCTLTGYAYGAVLSLRLSKPGYLSFSRSFSTWTEGTSYVSAKLLKIPPPTVVPALQYASTIATESKTFAWTYAGTAFTWKVSAPSSLLSFSRDQPLYIAKFVASDGTTQQNMLNARSPVLNLMLYENLATSSMGDYTAWTQETANTAYVQQLALRLALAAKTAGYDYFHKAEFILNFVQFAIPSKITPFEQLPVQTLFESGKCIDKSILYASILKALGYKVALLGFPSNDPSIDAKVGYSGHEAVGIAFTLKQMTQTTRFTTSNPCAYYTKNGLNYYFAETTLQGWILGQQSLPKNSNITRTAFVYPLN